MNRWKYSSQPTATVFIPPYSLVQSRSGEEGVYIEPGSPGTFVNVWFHPDQGIVVNTGDRLEVFASPLEAGRMALCAVELLNEMVPLLAAALPAVDEEEARQAANYAEEVLSGQLALDLGQRIRRFLEAAQSTIGSIG
jgi:hypothetical protein